MKKPLLLLVSLCILVSVRANTYYSANNTAPNTTGNWHTNRNGTGTSPSNFNSTDIFIVQAGHTITTTANWTLGGNNAKIIIENGATLQADDKITVDIFQVDNGATYIHNDNSSSIPGTNTRSFGTTSTVEINNWNGGTKLPALTTWGNLIIDMPGYNSNINQAGNLTDIAGNFIIRSTGNSGKEFRLASAEDYTLTIGGDLIIEGGILDASQSNGSATQAIIINGSFDQSGGTFIRSNNNSNVLVMQFNGSNSNFIQTGGTLTNTYINWKVNTAKKLTLSNNLPVALSRSMTVSGTLDCSSSSITGLGSFIINASGSLITSNASGLAGSLGITGTTTLTTGASYVFNAATTTAFPALISSVSAANITVGANVTFNKDVTITGTLTLSSGKMTIPAGNTVTLASGIAVAGSGFGTAKHIVTQVNTLTGTKGYFRIQNFTGATSIPVGNGTYYLPVTLTATGTNDFTVCVFNGVTGNGQPDGTAFTTAQKQSIVDAVWHINRNGGASAVMMQLAWPAALEGSTFQTLAGTDIGVAHYGTAWEAPFGTGDQTLNTATRTGIVSFSPFAVGRGGAPLPLKFGDIKAVQKNDAVQVDWYSLTETNLDHYEVERSMDGRNFITIGQAAARGNNNDRADYLYKDNISNDGIFFYRIKAVDIDSKSSYSSIVRISLSKQLSAEMVLYPNPVSDQRITVQATYLPKSSYKLNVFNLSGTSVYQQNFEHGGGAISQQIQLPLSLHTGIYIVSVTNGAEIKMTKPFMLK
jgi:Secretion system C-terminal sorting domain